MPNSGGHGKPTQEKSTETIRVRAFPSASPKQRDGRGGPSAPDCSAWPNSLKRLGSDGTPRFPSAPRARITAPAAYEHPSPHLLKYLMEAHRCLENKSRTIRTRHRKELRNMCVYTYTYASFKTYCHQQRSLKYIYLRSLLSRLLVFTMKQV